MRYFLVALSLLPLCCSLSFRFSAHVSYEQDIGGHLKRAGDANTPELARQELDVAIANMEKRGLTQGYTSILYKTPDADIGFWHDNIVAARGSLDELGPDADQLTISNELMKLRETLMDHGESGDVVTAPGGISYYPDNFSWAVFDLVSSVGGLASALYFLIRHPSHPRYRSY